MADVFPSGLFDISTVEVRVIHGVYIPCKSCHWFSTCVVPKGKYLPPHNSFLGSYASDFSPQVSRRIFQCQEYTVLKPT